MSGTVKIVPVPENCTRLSAVRKDDQLRIRTGQASVEARVRAAVNGGQESAGRKGDQPRIRTGKASVEVRVRVERAGARGPPKLKTAFAAPLSHMINCFSAIQSINFI